MLHSPGDIIAKRYRIVATLGQASRSNTYVAEDLIEDKLVAIKAILLQQMNDWKDFELLERQAKVLAHIDHPSVPKYIKYFHLDTDRDRSFYLVQQLIKGDSLADLVAQGWRTDEVEVQDIAFQVLDILKYLHQSTPPVIHRDIQPCNLIRGAKGHIFLVDFGSVKATCSFPQTYSTTFIGAYGYMSPEQFSGKAYFASDLYSLGASLLFVLTGKDPDEFLQKNMKVDFCNHVRLSPRFANWLEKMLEPSPKARFHSAVEAIASLQQQKTSLPNPKIQTPKSALKSQFSTPKGERRTQDKPRKQQPAGSQVIVRRGDGDGRFVIEIPPGGSINNRHNLLDVFKAWYRLEISPQHFSISRGNNGFHLYSHAGKTSDLIKAELRIESDIWGATKHTLLIWEGVTAHTFAPELTSVEKEWLVDEISDFLQYLETLQRLERLIEEL